MTFTQLAYWKVVRERFTKWVFGQHYIHRLRIEKISGKYLLLQCSQIKQTLAEKRTPSVWRRSVRKTYNEHVKPSALRFPVKQEKNEYLPNRQTCRTAKTNYTLWKQEERNTAINDMFALTRRSAIILSSQRQQIREKTQRIQYLLKISKSSRNKSASRILFTHT